MKYHSLKELWFMQRRECWLRLRRVGRVFAPFAFLGGLSLHASTEPSTEAREIIYHETETPVVNTQIGYVTAVYLPKSETILWGTDHPIQTGQREFFEVTASGSVLYIHPMDLPHSWDPQTGGKATNVSISLASGNHVDLMVRECSKLVGVHADLKVFLRFGDSSMVVASDSAPKFIPASEKSALEQQLQDKDKQIAALQAQQRTAAQVAVTEEANSVSHDYEFFDRKGKEDYHAAVWRDKTFTYIEVPGQEKPTVWEIKDGKPAKVESLWQGDKCTIQHLIDIGELRAGKSSIKFRYAKEDKGS